MLKNFRVEKDTLGTVKVPAKALYGAQTRRAVDNFPISGLMADPEFIKSYVEIKRASAVVHKKLGQLPARIADAIIRSADEILAGEHLDQWVVDVYQAGAGTSFNMNTNEVLANLANLKLGGKLGDYKPVHPNDHINKSQSTNDTFPTAIRITTLILLREKLYPAITNLANALKRNGAQFADIPTSGRTHLMDATPILMGQIFSGYGEAIHSISSHLKSASIPLHRLNIGGTAVGTGTNTHPRYAKMMAEELSSRTRLKLKSPKNLVELAESSADFSFFAGTFKALSLELGKIANDLRLMASGPTSGLNELILPAVQPGSSIMPGKVNPVMLEMFNQVCFQVAGQMECAILACQAGQLQMNVMFPVVAHSFNHSINILANACTQVTEKCVKGMVVNEERCRRYFESSPSIATALNPLIGYERTAKLVKKAVSEKRPILEVIRESGLLSEKQLAEVFKPERLTRPADMGTGKTKRKYD